MPNCKNNKGHYYKGTEPSPKGLGWCSGSMKEKTKKKGKDGNTWIVTKLKNGSKRWIKYTKTETKCSPQNVLRISQKQTLKIIKTKLKKELEKIGVKVFIETNKPINNIYIEDIPWNNVAKKLKLDFISDSPFPIIIVVIKKDQNTIVLDNGGVYIQHSGITYSVKKKVIKLLKDMFGVNYKWNGSQSKEMFIKL